MVETRPSELLLGKLMFGDVADDSAWNLKDIKVSCHV